jgi:protein-disulfide isomerase
VTNARVTREARQEKLAAMRAQAARQQARRRTALATGIVLVVIALVVAIFVIVQNARRDGATASAAPANLGPDNSFVVGGGGNPPVTLVAYEDFQCPVCKQFEAANSSQIDTWVKAGTVKVEYRPIAFLDRMSSTKYSTRALNAAAAVLNSSPSAFPAFHELLFANQPAENSAGLSDAKLVDLAVQAGADRAAVTTAVKNQTYKGWTVSVTEAASKAGITATPTLQVNGETLKDYRPATVKAAVDAAAKK